MSYPLYRAHGNRVSTLMKGAGGTYAYSALRGFDAWGKVRSGATTGDPTGRYCANLGHKQDDESDLIYMRARYYEPSSGRFLSEDPDRQGSNWMIYCSNQPIDCVDADGKFVWYYAAMIALGVISGVAGYCAGQKVKGDPITTGGLANAIFVGVVMGALGAAVGILAAGGALTAAAALDAIYVGFAVAVFGVGVQAVGAGIERTVDKSGAKHAVSMVQGGQLLAMLLLWETENE